MDAIRVVLTYEDYAALPDDGRRYEIHDGELSVTPSPRRRHQEVIGNLYVALRTFVSAHRLGQVFLSPFDVILSNTNVVVPDLTYVAPDRSNLVSDRGIEGAPTLAIEVLSPWSIKIDRQTKLQLYARHDVPYYWIVDPEARSIEVYTRETAGYVLSTTAEPFTGLALPLASIWA